MMFKQHIRRLGGRVPKSVQGWLAYLAPCHERSFGQFGEDLLLTQYLPEPTGFYVDVGAFHPKYRSNTYRLWRRGWRGINVDVDEYKIAQFRKFRPNDVNVVAALSSETGSRNFYYQAEESYGSMSSLDEDFAIERGVRMKRNVAKRVVEVTTLNRLLDEYLPVSHNGQAVPIDLINIDVEGHENEILRTFDFHRFRSRCICVEIHAKSLAALHDNPTYQLVTDMGYDLVAWPAPSCLFVRPTASSRQAA